MKNIILSGCSGKMGKAITAAVNENDKCQIIAGFDPYKSSALPYSVYESPFDFTGTADVIIDFSHPSATAKLLEFAVARNIAAVICTTGLSDEQINSVKDAGQKIPVFYSGNMSLGVNLLIELSKKATAVLGNDFDIEIIEKHHNQKIDAPSGTALMIADAISDTLEQNPKYEYDRHSKRMKRNKNEIGIHAVRGGNIVGEHEVIFAGRDEIITLSHSARSKDLFATGAINAALFLANAAPGIYDMGDLISAK